MRASAVVDGRGGVREEEIRRERELKEIKKDSDDTSERSEGAAEETFFLFCVCVLAPSIH